mmetsp:Transcript_767/g.656  ORF Transcript_767/g.656 Transcript_767/m.656 type:complete len:120 (-) Transcript_767:2-361(-)
MVSCNEFENLHQSSNQNIVSLIISYYHYYHNPTHHYRTMWAIFFAGEDYAPNTKIDNENAGVYLRRHYYNAISILADALKDEPNVLGFETLNEPNMGWIGRSLPLDKFNAPSPYSESYY